MAQYLLKASDEEMSRWKAAAKAEGISFAAWLREAAERNLVQLEALHQDEPLPNLYKIPIQQPAPHFPGKRTFSPDPK